MGLLGDDATAARASTSSSGSARSATSAARRQHCSTPSRAIAESLGRSRPFPRRGSLRSADAHSQRRDAAQRALHRARRRRRVPRARHKGIARHEALLRVGLVRAPGVYELPFGVTLARSSRRRRAPRGPYAASDFFSAAPRGLCHGRAPRHAAHPRRRARSRRHAGLGRGARARRFSPIGPVLTRIARFFREESCGQCTPCRVGTARQHELHPSASRDPSDARSETQTSRC